MPVVQITGVVNACLRRVNQKRDALIGRAVGIDLQKGLLPRFSALGIPHEAAELGLGLRREQSDIALHPERQRGATYIVREKVDHIVRPLGERKDALLKVIRMRMAHKHKERFLRVRLGELAPIVVEEQIHLFQFHIKSGVSNQADSHLLRHPTFCCGLSVRPLVVATASIT